MRKWVTSAMPEVLPRPTSLETGHPNAVTSAEGKELICETITLSVQTEVTVSAGINHTATPLLRPGHDASIASGFRKLTHPGGIADRGYRCLGRLQPLAHTRTRFGVAA